MHIIYSDCDCLLVDLGFAIFFGEATKAPEYRGWLMHKASNFTLPLASDLVDQMLQAETKPDLLHFYAYNAWQLFQTDLALGDLEN